ncbi:MAG: hypothetical protein JWQ90_630 [Hydrocarboniphaga sp.]|uniref:hypothetical protein n=1 Tax=Hydrocarboniphaga sp. TaxID=2033016 RepID=UPI00261A18C5|nr:hypothetical protein [Hydrocarboniphaga sp.]MDB5968180.1 hypothetical protein [Hydrocarboniphaga sp.]
MQITLTLSDAEARALRSATGQPTTEKAAAVAIHRALASEDVEPRHATARELRRPDRAMRGDKEFPTADQAIAYLRARFKQA